MLGRLDVDPGRLSGAGAKLNGDGTGLAGAMATLISGLSGTKAGHDAAARKFTTEYLQSSRKWLTAGAAAVNACRRVGMGIQMSAYNYALSNAMATPGGGQVSVPMPRCAVPVVAPELPCPQGTGVAAPALWSLVEMFVGDVWPDGDPGSLRAAARLDGLRGGDVAHSR